MRYLSPSYSYLGLHAAWRIENPQLWDVTVEESNLDWAAVGYGRLRSVTGRTSAFIRLLSALTHMTRPLARASLEVTGLHSSVQFCTVLHCSALSCTVLHCSALF